MKLAARYSAVVVCALSIAPLCACQHNDPSARVAALCDACDRPDLPGGFALAVVQDERLLFKGAYGLADSEHQVPFRTSTVFDFASVAKQFTGFAVATLVRDGRLSLDDDIHRYLPELPDFGEKVTIGHLLHHTSGIRDWVGLVKLSGTYDGDAITGDFLMKLIRHQRELNFKPGERFQYSNTGYVLLARIVARITGEPFPQWAHEHIFEPLQMRDTHLCDDYREIVPNRAASYTWDEDGRYVNSSDQLEASGSSSLYSTVDDMLKWMANYRTKELGGAAVWDMMLAPGALNNGGPVNYGFGVSLDNRDGSVSFGHGGSWAGFLCQLSYYPEHDITTILAVNRNPAGFDVSSKLMGILLDRDAPGDAPPEVASEDTEVDLSPERLAEYAGPYQLAHDLMWVERLGEELMVRFAWGPQAPVYAVGNDLFLGRGFDGRFTFLRGADGTIDRLVFSLSGKERGPFRKLDERATTFRDVASFVGEYSSPELLTTYTVGVKNDRLVLGHLRNEDVVLQQLDRDDYRANAWWCTKIRVIRDGGDRITGFRLDADEDNVQNLWFARVPTD